MALRAKQQAFVEAYLRSFNATDAARVAGYSEKTASSIGHENLKKPEIAAEIERRLAEMSMSADEALVRLTEQARGEYAQYITADGTVDLFGMINDGKTHLISSVKATRYGLAVEFYDAQAALDKILRARGAYVDRMEVTGEDGGPVAIRTIEVHHRDPAAS